jgi:hypothetical protein
LRKPVNLIEGVKGLSLVKVILPLQNILPQRAPNAPHGLANLLHLATRQGGLFRRDDLPGLALADRRLQNLALVCWDARH